ncbi:MAG: pyrroline-5-carboxylate reductase [Bacillota bacterium]
MRVFGKIAFIGAGNMAEAMIKGLISSGLAEPSEIFVTNKADREKLERLNAKWGVRTSYDRKNVLEDARIVILAVKPQDMETALLEIKGFIKDNQLVISTAAGLSLEWFEKRLNNGVPVVRTMSNLPCQVKAGATAVTMGRNTNGRHRFLVDAIFNSLGIVVHVREDLIDTITGLSGSGPAYVYLMISALADAGEQSGLSKEVAFELAVQTVFGAAKLVKESGIDSKKLVQLTASKGGTTLAGLQELEQGGFTKTIGAAVKMAAKRSKELSLSY